MKNVSGYVFLADFGDLTRLFGRKVTKILPHNFENLQTNGIAPYRKLTEARRGVETYEEVISGVVGTKVGRLEMQIAESVDELEHFRNKRALIVIAHDEFDEDFLGPKTKDGKTRAYLPGMSITNNGFKQFRTGRDMTAYERAEYLLSEVNRQAKSPATIATFDLKFIQ
jgi:hypothetical protein